VARSASPGPFHAAKQSEPLTVTADNVGPGEREQRKEPVMLYWSAVFFVIAIIAALLGFTGITIISVEIAKILFFVFLILFLVSLVGALVTGRRPPPAL
jgi:uncharacterized membrane protein YtjA (UPF0391 family)